MRRVLLAQLSWLILGLGLNAPGQLLSSTRVVDLFAIPGEWCIVVLLAALALTAGRGVRR